jgi:hypothetical protein
MFRARGLGIIVLLFAISLPAVTLRIYASDEVQYFAFLRSLWFDHDVEFDNEYRHFVDERGDTLRGFAETFLAGTTPTGHRLSFATIGSALLWAPFYAAGDLTARTLRALGAPVGTDGYSLPYVAAVCYGSAVYGLASLLLSAAIARRFVAHTAAAVSAVWLGTPLLFYVYIGPVFAHACSAFAVALLIWLWLRARDRQWPLGDAVLVGLAGALATMVREQDALLLVGPAIDFVWWATAQRGQRLRHAATAAVTGLAAFAIAYLPQALAYLALNGHLRPAGVVTRKMSWSSPHALDVLFSTSHGLVFWTPLVVLAVAGLVLLWSRARRLAGYFLLMAAAAVYVSGSVESWTVAGAFGQRRFVSLTPLLVVGLAVLFDAARRQAIGVRVTAALAVGACLWWNVGLVAAFGMHRMDRQRLTLADNARTVFLQLPREAGSIAWRYVFDRSSFYHLPPQ